MEVYNIKEGISRDYFPIPHRGFILLCSAALASALAYLFKLIGMSPGFAVFLTLLLGMGFWPIILGQPFHTWIKDYWRRNVRGYMAVFMARHSTEIERIPHVDIWPNRTTLFSSLEEFRVLIPLGGWKKEPLIITPKGKYTRWKIKKYRFHSAAGLQIQITDRWGDGTTMEIEHLTEILQFSDYTSGIRSLGEVLYSLHKTQKDLEEKLRWTQVQATMRNKTIYGAIKALAQSQTRFGKCQEAKEIKQQLAQDLLNTLGQEEEWQRPFLESCLPKKTVTTAN